MRANPKCLSKLLPDRPKHRHSYLCDILENSIGTVRAAERVRHRIAASRVDAAAAPSFARPPISLLNIGGK